MGFADPLYLDALGVADWEVGIEQGDHREEAKQTGDGT